jgi:hypothetical protein
MCLTDFIDWRYIIYRQYVAVGGVLSCVVDHILQEFNTDQILNLQNCYTTRNKNDQ